MSDLSRRVLRYVGHDRAMQRLRDLVRYGHEMTADEVAFAERALAGPTPAGRWDSARGASGESGMRIGTETLLETDYYVAELIDYTDQRADGTPLMSNPYSADDESVPQWRFTWEIDHEGEAITLSSWINKPADPNDISPRSNLAKVVAALLPNHAAVDWTVDTLLHQRCRLQVELGTKQDGSKVNRIKGYHPLKAAAARGTTSAPARQPVPTVAQRRVATAVADPRVEEDEAPPF